MIEHIRKQQEDARLLTGDTRMTLDEEKWVMSQGPLHEISGEELLKLAQRAATVKAQFDIVATAGMTMARALRIRELRITSSWRTIAALCHVEWGQDALWEPHTNQLAGMALCEAAATKLGEDPERSPWQSVS